jgi:hypothetical protein
MRNVKWRGDDQLRETCVNPFEEVGAVTHESVANAVEICGIAHFLGEYISGIALPADVRG